MIEDQVSSFSLSRKGVCAQCVANPFEKQIGRNPHNLTLRVHLLAMFGKVTQGVF
jgi:hypothetical protein